MPLVQDSNERYIYGDRAPERLPLQKQEQQGSGSAPFCNGRKCSSDKNRCLRAARRGTLDGNSAEAQGPRKVRTDNVWVVNSERGRLTVPAGRHRVRRPLP